MAPKKTVRTPRSRTENHKAVQEVLETAQERSSTSPEEAKVATQRVVALKESTKALTIEAEAKNLTQVSLDITSQIQGLQNELGAQISKLNEVKESTEIYKAELVELGRKDILTTELKALAEEHNAKVDQYAKEIAELEERKAKQEEANEDEQEKYETERNEERQREEKEYNYNLAQTRKQETDTFNQKVAQTKYQESERQRDFNKQMIDREAKVAAAEKEIIDLRAKVAGFDAEMAKEVSKRETILKNVLTKDFANEKALMQKDIESASKLSAIEIGGLKQQVLDLNTQLTQVKGEAKEAQNKVAEIANKALESASGQSELATLRNTVQNNNGSQSNTTRAKQ